MSDTVIYVQARGLKAQVVPALTAFANAIIDTGRGRLAMRDPAAFTHDGYITDRVEVHVHAANDEQDARAIVRAILDQIPGAGDVLAPARDQ